MKTIVLLALVIGFAGCSRDHDLDDYKTEQFQKDYAKVASVAGRYSGSLKSMTTGKTLSALQITLRPNAKVITSGDPGTNPVKPVISAEIQFAGRSDSATIPVPDGTYVSESHLYHAELMIDSPTDASTKVSIDITGTIGDDGSFNGTMIEDGYQTEGGAFQLTRDGEGMKQLATELDLGDGSIFSSSADSGAHQFKGKFTNAKIQGYDVTMNVTNPTRTRLQEVSDLLLPSQERFVTVNLIFKQGNSIFFPTAELDMQSQTLRGSVTRVVQSGSYSIQMTVACDHFDISAQKYAFACAYINDTGNGTLQFQN